ncbi:hypothetical protein [Mycobacterium sp.]|uniref:hypothetical protein n=1 Tax=Mycobacterium sp. TaxID=1785 RepID=UPI00345C4223
MSRPPSWPSTPPGPSAPPQPPTRPVDVDTGFWLWMAALPLMVIGYVADLVGSGAGRGSVLVYAASGLFAAVVCAIVVTFLILMRAGYRWARTVLTGGGLATISYVMLRLFSVDWPPLAAITCAVTGIVGSVLIAGAIFLLHRRDAHAYFTR